MSFGESASNGDDTSRLRRKDILGVEGEAVGGGALQVFVRTGV